MTSEFGKLNYNQQDSSKEEPRKPLELYELEQILNSSYDPIFVTDKFGNVLLVNSSTEKILGVKSEELIRSNVKDLLKNGLYDWSPSLKAIETRSVVSGLLRTKRGVIMCTSTPVMDENGEIIMVTTNARDKDLVDKYIEALENEQSNAERYKTAVEYLSEVELDPIVAENGQMSQILETTKIIAKTDITVMLMGESGTGKEVMAKYIHRNSLRSKEPLIPVNCAAIPSELLESEFFGYVSGAFTGANVRGKPGLFEIADKGTLFLDEIGELPLAMQSKLLRVLETGEIQRVGSTTIQRTNVRLIAATNRDLKAMINQKLFRNDLYYRLNVIPINLPPLRERPEDILIIAHRFLTELNKKYALQKTFTPRTIEAFLKYNWPGNVRELRNVIERMVIISAGNNLNFEDDFLISSETQPKREENYPVINKAYKGSLKNVMKDLEEQYIRQVLAECNGQVKEAALRLGVHRSILYRKLAEEKQ